MDFNVENIRKEFPILKKKINGKQLIYFDNAATSQTPKCVIDSISNYYKNYNSNIHRGVHSLSEEATEAYEESREKVKNHFNAKYKDCKTDYTGKGVDQLQSIINSLSHPTEKFSRRLIMSAWNPCQIDEMALPPCHVLTQFNVNSKNELSCLLFQRSGDVGLGVPFNMASYGFLTCLLATHCGLNPGKLIHTIGDAHIYEEHIPMLKQQIERKPYPSPILTIDKKSYIDDYSLEDFQLNNYKAHPVISMKMIA